MSRAAALLALLGALAAAPAGAQTVALRSGEHEGFTRLVLPLPPGAPWGLVPAPGGVDLALPPNASFDVSGVFRRIARDRIAALRPLGEGWLRIDVACLCHVDTFIDGGSSLVIDVVDGPAPPGGLAPGLRAPLRSMGPFPLLVAAPPADPLLFSSPGGAPWTPAVAPPAPAAPESPDHARRVAETEAAIVEGFARAATQDLLELASGQELPDPPEPPPPAAAPASASTPASTPAPTAGTPLGPRRTAVPAPVAPGPVPAGEPLAALAAEPQLSLRTSIDRDRPEAPLAADGARCLAPEGFDLAAWDEGGDFAAVIASRTARATLERDGWDEAAVEDLARAYLAFGFGREAAQALGLDGRSSAARDQLVAMARIVDGDPPAADAFADQRGCLGPVALWRALARGDVAGTDAQERTAILVALRALPDAVRGHLSVRVSELYLDAGEGEEAQAVLAVARGTTAAGGTEARLAGAAVAEALDGPAPAIAGLEAVAAEDARVTPAAVVDLVDLTLAAGRVVSDDVLDLARSLRFEHRGRADEAALLLAEIRALAGASRFSEALGLLAEGDAVLPADEAGAALGAVATELTAKLDDAAFLEAALLDLPPVLPLGAAEAVARRLDVMGFAPEADALLARAATPQPAAAPAPAAAPVGPVREAGPDARGPEPAFAAREALVAVPAPPPLAAPAAVPATDAPPGPRAAPALAAPPAALADALPAVAGPALAAPPRTPAPPAPTPIVLEPALAVPPLPASEPALPQPPTTTAPPSNPAPPASMTPPAPLPTAAPLATLAGRRELLDQAATARSRAAALLDLDLAAGE